MPPWRAPQGIPGLFLVDVIDSSVIPLPRPGSPDVLLVWFVSHSGDPWLLVPSAIVGSIVGGYTTWLIGRRGGETALRRHVPARLLTPIIGWVQRHPVLAVFLPALLPPPIPLLPFALAAGALGVGRGRFLTVFGAARSLRYCFVAWLAVTYGRRLVHVWTGTINKWSIPLLCTFAALVIAGLVYGVWKARELRKSNAAGKEPLETDEVRSA